MTRFEKLIEEAAQDLDGAIREAFQMGVASALAEQDNLCLSAYAFDLEAKYLDAETR